jgi:hypothetical protein
MNKGYADDTLAGKAKPKGSAGHGKGADTDHNYGSGRHTMSPARQWDDGGTRSRRGAPRPQEGRKLSDGNYADAEERGSPKLKGGTAVED